MRNIIKTLLKTGLVTYTDLFPDLPEETDGLPGLAETPCRGTGCALCRDACPTGAIRVEEDASGGVVHLDRGLCIGCTLCVRTCPTGTLIRDRSTRTAVRTREELVLSNRNPIVPTPKPKKRPFLRSLHVREVSTGCSAADLECLASTNAVFDTTRFGIQYVASPRFADALVVTGPVGRGMQEALRRCYDAMADPRIVIAFGTSAVSGGVHGGGYAEANGVSSILPVDVFVPGEPPHPWSLLYAMLLAMGRL